MIKINVTTREGAAFPLDWEEGVNLMEVIRDVGASELQGLCGGQVSCATCHVYISPEYLHLLPPITEHEGDLLDSSDHRMPASRLSCQIECRPELDGMAVEIAPEY